jgi:putative endonuclease
MFYVYVLRSSKTGRRYVGSCENVDDRLRRHDAATPKRRAIAFHGSWCTVKSFSNRAEAAKKERYYKSGRGRDDLDRLYL